MKRHLKNGLLAGLAGGVALAIVLLTIGEGPIGQAVGLEKQAANGQHKEMFSRGTQQIGGAIGGLIYGIALGAIFAVAYAALRRRLSTRQDWRASLQLAAIGFVTVFFIPFLKYPPNPPAVGSPDTIGRRTALYLVMLAWSIVATWAAWLAARALERRGAADHLRPLAMAAIYVALIAFGFVLLPGTPDPVNAPATLVWNFRLASLAGSAAYWSVTGVVFGWLRVTRAPDLADEALAPAEVR
ncbi:MAG: CbtA family protein [Actinomycetota bacterium]|nr:CbtA family protein [Actinomycetota bacterium]